MDIKQFMVGVIMAVIVFSAAGLALYGLSLNYTGNTNNIDANYKSIQQQAAIAQNETNTTSESMQKLFGQSPSGSGSLNDLYTAAGGTAKLTMTGIGSVWSMLKTVGSGYGWAQLWLAYAFTALGIVIVISIAYLVFFRIPR